MIYRELTYRAKSIAVKAVSMVITFHPNMPMWNFHILLFVTNGSKKNCKNGSSVKKKNLQCFVRKIHIFMVLEFDLAYHPTLA